MPFREIKFKKNNFYHIYNYGMKNQPIFLDDNDMQRFLLSMFFSKSSRSVGGISEIEYRKRSISLSEIKNIADKKNLFAKPLVELFSYCLLPNHFHIFLQEKEENGTAKFMQKLGNSFGKYFSNKYGKKGGIFAGRFKACEVKSDEEIKNVLAYINAINPGQLKEPHMRLKGIENFASLWEAINYYQWSSHQEFIENREPILVSVSLRNKMFSNAKKYQDFVRDILLENGRSFWEELGNLSLD